MYIEKAQLCFQVHKKVQNKGLNSSCMKGGKEWDHGYPIHNQYVKEQGPVLHKLQIKETHNKSLLVNDKRDQTEDTEKGWVSFELQKQPTCDQIF